MGLTVVLILFTLVLLTRVTFFNKIRQCIRFMQIM